MEQATKTVHSKTQEHLLESDTLGKIEGGIKSDEVYDTFNYNSDKRDTNDNLTWLNE